MDHLPSNVKRFPDDTSLFSVVHDVNASARDLYNDLKKINKWAFQWKMSFNPDPSKQAQEVIFSRKIKKLPHPSLVFNNNNVLQASSQKHLGVTLDVKLTFDEHLNNVLNKVNKTIGLLCKLQNLLSRSTLITIYKAFARPHLDYGDILFDQTYNSSFQETKTNILQFIQPSPNSVYNFHNPKGLEFITRLRIGLSYLREHKFKHSFQDTINPLCNCGLDIESTEHFLLHCPQFVNERRTLLSTIGNINYKLLENTDSVLTQTLLFDNTSFDITDNTKILNATTNFILLTKRFEEHLF